MTVKLNNIEMYYEKTGSGSPLLLLHGNGEDHSIFDKLAEKLSQDFTVYAVDSRNHGQSEKTADYRYETMAEDLKAFIETLNLGKADIIGFSDGAIVSLLLAMKHDELINKMALLGINLSPEDFTEENYRYIKDMYEETKDPLWEMMLTQPQISLDEVRTVQIPSLVIAAEDDLFRPDTFTKLTEALPNAELRIIKGHDHGSYVINQDILYPELLGFFRSPNGKN